jgi:hypothetical protein
MNQRDLWLVIPVANNALWFVITIIVGSLTSFPLDGSGCALVAVFTSTVAIAAIGGFVVNDIGPAKTFVAMVGQTCVLILMFALVYYYRLDIEGMTYGDALYYSVLTWTSLGYADLSPSGEMRLVTAVQAITGYVYLGLLVSVLASVVGRAKDGPATPN